jgi:quinoprotein glucose dehydrogenase
MSNQNPPRVLGGLLAVLGVALILGGYGLLQQGDSAYFLVAGLGICLSGILVALGKLLGAWFYAATFALMVVWSFVETKGDFGQLLPRILVPAVLCAYIFSGRVRPRLSW